MRTWRPSPPNRTLLFAPVGLRLVDGFTNESPLGRVEGHLDRERPGGGWELTGRRGVRTPSGVLAFPGLGRAVQARGRPPERYRVRLEARFYRPAYRSSSDGIEFDVPAFNDLHAPDPAPPRLPLEAVLLPSSVYPFPSHVRVLRGLVVDGDGDAIEDALVREGTRERVLTDERGAFSLPLRFVDRAGPVSIAAENERTGGSGSITVTLPEALSSAHVIPIP